MESVLERFLRYVKIDTQADEESSTYPSTAGQLDLCRMLAEECRELNLDSVEISESGIVTATVPSNVSHPAPAIAWLAHVDTSPEFSGRDVKPVLHENYDGADIVLPSDSSRVIRVAENPALTALTGGTVVTSDGTTLLGADDKAGIAVMMSAADYLLSHPDVPRGPVRLCFTCDEEIGLGVDHVDVPKLNCVCGYTLDGEGQGRIDCETFSADGVVITVDGINTHPSEGCGAMVNAIRILSAFLAELPVDRMCPEVTQGRQGFIHPYDVKGGVAQASAKLILRDFESAELSEYAALLESIADPLRERHPRARINIDVRKQYRNLRDGLKTEPRAVAKAELAMRRIGIEPELAIIRGGTDGSLLTEVGVPTPNLTTGEHNPHSPLEWTSREEMQTAVNVLIALAECWSSERV